MVVKLYNRFKRYLIRSYTDSLIDSHLSKLDRYFVKGDYKRFSILAKKIISLARSIGNRKAIDYVKDKIEQLKIHERFKLKFEIRKSLDIDELTRLGHKYNTDYELLLVIGERLYQLAKDKVGAKGINLRSLSSKWYGVALLNLGRVNLGIRILEENAHFEEIGRFYIRGLSSKRNVEIGISYLYQQLRIESDPKRIASLKSEIEYFSREIN